MRHLLDRLRRNKQEGAFAFAPEVTVRIHEQGAVFLHNAKGVVYSCNRVGAQLWAGLREGRPVAAIAGAIAQEYGVRAELVASDAARFVADLENAGILVRGKA